jgi:FkbM family methyltransferase
MRTVTVNDVISLVRGRDGYFLVNRNDYFVGQALELYGEYGALEAAFLKRLVRPGANVVEVGANIGAHTIGLAKAVGPQGKVYAFEPQRACFALLQAQIALNQIGNIIAYNQGVGGERGRLWVPRVNYGQVGNFGGVSLAGEPSADAEAVEIVTLDDCLGGQPCALIKIDVEGMEEAVIRGGMGVITKQRPMLYVENDRVEKSQALTALLLELGYRIWWHVTPLYNPNNYFGDKDNVYKDVNSFNIFCCMGEHEAAQGLREIRSPDDPHPLAGGITRQRRTSAAASLQAAIDRGMALHQQGRVFEAERVLQDVLRQRPDEPGLLHQLGVLALRTGRIDLAIELFDRAIALKPDVAEPYSDRGMALRKLGRYEDALASYERALALKPDFAMAFNNRGSVLLDLNRPADALASCEQAIALSPDLAIAHYNRGNALRDLRRPAEALTSYDRAIALKADFVEAHWDQSLCLLLLGRFDQGWPKYEWRKKRDEAVAVRSFAAPLWRGEQDLAGKTLFLWWEQGMGDTIQFSRYAKLAQARGAKVVMSVQQPLHELLRQIGPGVEIVGPDEVPAAFDYHCPLLGLPLAFGTTLDTIPAQQPPLKPDPARAAAWMSRIPARTKPRIGLVWSGRADHRNDRNRSIELQTLLPLLGAGADWFCLQKEIRAADRAAFEQSGRIAFFGDELDDFSDTAALVDLMDLVITVDTSVAHLAGAMAKPVWVLLPFSPDWRWLLERDDSPWYPGARLFRQAEIGNWQHVIERVGRELRAMIG